MIAPTLGVTYGSATVLRRVRAGRWWIRCTCGHEHEIGTRALAAQKYGVSSGCYWCRAARPSYAQREVTCVTSGCEAKLARTPPGRVRARCKDCKRKASTANSLRRALETLGRICAWCGRTDADHRWSGRLDTCARCERQGSPSRNGRCPCGSPLWKGNGQGLLRDRPLTCRAGCGWTRVRGLVAGLRILQDWNVEVDLESPYRGQCSVSPEARRATIYGWDQESGGPIPEDYWLHEVLHVALTAFKANPTRQAEERLVQDLCRLLRE